MNKIKVTKWEDYGADRGVVRQVIAIIDNTKEARQKLVDEEIHDMDWTYGCVDSFVNDGDLSDLTQEDDWSEWDDVNSYGFSFTPL